MPFEQIQFMIQRNIIVNFNKYTFWFDQIRFEIQMSRGENEGRGEGCHLNKYNLWFKEMLLLVLIDMFCNLTKYDLKFRCREGRMKGEERVCPSQPQLLPLPPTFHTLSMWHWRGGVEVVFVSIFFVFVFVFIFVFANTFFSFHINSYSLCLK